MFVCAVAVVAPVNVAPSVIAPGRNAGSLSPGFDGEQVSTWSILVRRQQSVVMYKYGSTPMKIPVHLH